MEQNSKGLEYHSNHDGTCAITGIGTHQHNNIVIPEKSPTGDVVIAIADGAFSQCTSLVSIEIPDSVTSIGSGAFEGCKSLITPKSAYKAFRPDRNKNLIALQHHKKYRLNHKCFARGVLECCKNGLHYCTNLLDIFTYYDGTYERDFVVAICDVSEENVGHTDDSKRCARWIRPTKILTREELIQLLNTRKKE